MQQVNFFSHVALDHSYDTFQLVLSIISLNLHPMQTTSKSGIIEKKTLLSTLSASQTVDLSAGKPQTYKSAVKSPVWLQAMKEEIEALHHQGTRSLVSLPTNKNLVG